MKIELLDKGYVELIDIMGDDYRILESARISTGSEPVKGDSKDKGLIRYLYRNLHMTPFEQVTVTLRIKCPIFNIRQWHRHRTASYNEMSARYTELKDEYYTPDHWRKQGDKNHQGSGDNLSPADETFAFNLYKNTMEEIYKTYHMLIDMGVAREQARMILPVAQYSEFYMTVNLRNLLHFISLRSHEHAQYEIRVYSDAILELLKKDDRLKWTMEVFEDMLKVDYILQDLKNEFKGDTNDLISILEQIKGQG